MEAHFFLLWPSGSTAAPMLIIEKKWRILLPLNYFHTFVKISWVCIIMSVYFLNFYSISCSK